MNDKPYLVKKLQPWEKYRQAEIGMPVECDGCTYGGNGSQYCNRIQQEEIEKQWSMYCNGKEPKTSEQFHLDCPKELQERQKEKEQRKVLF